MPKDAKRISTGVTNTKSQGDIIWFDSKELNNVTTHHFQADYWRNQNAITGSATGRGTTYFFKQHSHDFVLRHYRRGGLIGKLLTDQYLFTGLGNTRAWREMDLLMQMKALDLPAPTPVAARVQKRFFYYQADLITKKIANAQDVHQLLLTQAISAEVWLNIGATIAQFHRYQIYHHDLNIHNIMLDDKDKVWLIDFDKCSIKKGSKWKKQNLERLLRSLHKERQKVTDYYFISNNWQSLLSGYHQG